MQPNEEAPDRTDVCVRRRSDADIESFRNMWIPYHTYRRMTEKDYKYRIFPWDRILSHAGYTSWAAVRDDVPHGLIAMSDKGELKVEFLSTAPWNYGPNAVLVGIGAALLSFAVSESIRIGYGGRITLSSTPESESFYHHVGLVHTGARDHEDLAIFELPSAQADKFIRQRKPAQLCGGQ